MTEKPKEEEEIHIPVPDYDTECSNCFQTPTVTIRDSKGCLVTHMEMCGPCTFGEAAALNPENW